MKHFKCLFKKQKTDLFFCFTDTKYDASYSELQITYPFKGLKAEFPQFLVKVRWDIVAGIESMGGDGKRREGR